MIKTKTRIPPLIGLAHSDYIESFAKKYADLFDYIEVPLELLNHNEDVLRVSDLKPIILHCASLSIAGNILPHPSTIESIQKWIERTKTPWVGEHLSYITAPNSNALKYGDEYAPGQAYNIGYTMPPPLNDEALASVKRSIDNAQSHFSIPLILENPPIYFTIPGSDMDQIQFINKVAINSDVGLLLDLAHFLITSKNEGFDPLTSIEKLPLDKVVEIHISGVEFIHGKYWDHHASTAPNIEYELLRKVLDKVNPRAITLEFNWNSKFPQSFIVEEIQKVRQAIQYGRVGN